MSAAAKDAELYLRRSRKLEDVIADLLMALERIDEHVTAFRARPLDRKCIETVRASIAKAKAAL
jgi:hypothetical protein